MRFKLTRRERFIREYGQGPSRFSNHPPDFLLQCISIATPADLSIVDIKCLLNEGVLATLQDRKRALTESLNLLDDQNRRLLLHRNNNYISICTEGSWIQTIAQIARDEWDKNKAFAALQSSYNELQKYIKSWDTMMRAIERWKQFNRKPNSDKSNRRSSKVLCPIQ